MSCNPKTNHENRSDRSIKRNKTLPKKKARFNKCSFFFFIPPQEDIAVAVVTDGHYVIQPSLSRIGGRGRRDMPHVSRLFRNSYTCSPQSQLPDRTAVGGWKGVVSK